MGDFILFDQIVKIAGSIVTLSAAMAICVKPIREKVIRKLTRDDAARAGICALLRKQIIDACDKAREQDSLYLYERENLHDMFDQYEALGGNHGIRDIVEEALQKKTIVINKEKKRE